MRIAKNELLAGIPVLKIRDYFRLLYSGLMTRDGLAERFNLNEKETEGLVGELLSKGYIEPADNGMYRLTLKGNALSIARCMAPINREKADRIMQEFLKRVEEVNRDDFYPYRVSKLVLFGSYLNPEQMDLGDIDIAFELESGSTAPTSATGTIIPAFTFGAPQTICKISPVPASTVHT